MNKRVIEFFKRNKDSKGCHLVLQEVFEFGSRDAAGAYAKSKNAVVTSVSKEEFTQWAKKNKVKIDDVKEEDQNAVEQK